DESLGRTGRRVSTARWRARAAAHARCARRAQTVGSAACCAGSREIASGAIAPRPCRATWPARRNGAAMAINWIFALKAVPWADVVQAAPSIVKGARKLFNNARSSEPPPVGPEEFHPGADGGSTHARLRALEVAVRNLDAEQDSTAELIRSLAEQ